MIEVFENTECHSLDEIPLDATHVVRYTLYDEVIGTRIVTI